MDTLTTIVRAFCCYLWSCCQPCLPKKHRDEEKLRKLENACYMLFEPKITAKKVRGTITAWTKYNRVAQLKQERIRAERGISFLLLLIHCVTAIANFVLCSAASGKTD